MQTRPLFARHLKLYARLSIMSAAVPVDWKVHLHSYRGAIPVMHEMLTKWKQLILG